MRVKGLVWLGIPADDYAAAIGLIGTLGLDVAFHEANTVELSAENGDKVQLFGPGHRYFEYYRSQGARTVPLFEVDNLDEARTDMAGSGAEVIGGTESDGIWARLVFRGPEGNVHSVCARQT